jgi:hypothetical protein
MPPRESNKISAGRASDFTKGQVKPLSVTKPAVAQPISSITPPTPIKPVSAAPQRTVMDSARQFINDVPGAILNAAKTEASLPTNIKNSRLDGHIFNAASDTIAGIANIGINAVNSQFPKFPNGQPSVVYPNLNGPKLNVDSTTGKKSFAGGSLNRNPEVGTAKSFGVNVPGNPDETFNRGLETATTALPFLKPLKLLGKAGKVVNNKVATATKAVALNPAVKPVSPSSNMQFIGNMAHESAPNPTRLKPLNPAESKKSDANLNPSTLGKEPLRLVDRYSRPLTDNPRENSTEIRHSIFREAQANAEDQGYGVFSTAANYTNKSTLGKTTIDDAGNPQPESGMAPSHLDEVMRRRYAQVYDDMVENGTMDTKAFPDADSFYDNGIRPRNGGGYQHRIGGSPFSGKDSGPPLEIVQNANKAYLERFHGESASEKPISFYRTSNRDIGDDQAKYGDYSLDREMAFNYGPITTGYMNYENPKGKYRADVTADQLKHPLMGSERLDEWGQTFGDDIPESQFTAMGEALTMDRSPQFKSQQFRDFNATKLFRANDVSDSPLSLTDAQRARYGITKNDRETFTQRGGITDRYADVSENENGNFNITWDKKLNTEDMNPYYASLLKKYSKALEETGQIDKPLITNKFDFPRRTGVSNDFTVIGDPEGIYFPRPTNKDPRAQRTIRADEPFPTRKSREDGS